MPAVQLPVDLGEDEFWDEDEEKRCPPIVAKSRLTGPIYWEDKQDAIGQTRPFVLLVTYRRGTDYLTSTQHQNQHQHQCPYQWPVPTARSLFTPMFNCHRLWTSRCKMGRLGRARSKGRGRGRGGNILVTAFQTTKQRGKKQANLWASLPINRHFGWSPRSRSGSRPPWPLEAAYLADELCLLATCKSRILKVSR